MPRDYKHTAKKRKKGRAKAPERPRWVWLAAPAVAALMLGAGAYLHDRGDPAGASSARPAQDSRADARPAQPEDTREGKQAEHRQADAPAQYEFYTLLPEIEVEITDEDLGAALKALPEPSHQGPYVLQAGSFRHYEEADNLKARLALIGIEARIQTVTINEESTWYRVRIGPYDSLRDLKPVRSRLKHNDINFMLMSVAGEA